MRNFILILNVLILIMTLSILLLPKVWMITVVGGADGLTGVSFPIVWGIYIFLVVFTSGVTFSWLIKKKI